MNLRKNHRLLAGIAFALAVLSSISTAHANVYATDIQLNSTLTGTATNSVGSPVSITYHLNDAATAGVTVNILQGGTVVASVAGTTNKGLNTVSWTPSSVGTYSISITAASTGYPTWQQISTLTSNYVTVYGLGMAVDKNTNSPYYGRIVVGNALSGATQHGVTQNCGFYKYNADGTPADEGSFGYANYTLNDGGNSSSGQMPYQPYPGYGQFYNPSIVRIGEDDRIYWEDNSFGGKILACDILATTNQVIMPDSGYANCPATGNLNVNGYGWVQFDVINTGTPCTYTGNNGVYTGNAALFLCDEGDAPDQGVWMWHMVGTPGNMVADPTDTYGQQVIQNNSDSDSLELRVDGIAVDYKLDLFAGEDRHNPGDYPSRAAVWTNWNGGVLPPGDQGGAQGGGSSYTETAGALWTEGAYSSAPKDADVFDVVINSRTNPTLMVRSHIGNNGYGLDMFVPFNPTVKITGASLNGTTLTINCTSSSTYAPTASQLSLVGSSNANGTFVSVPATFTGSNGVFQATTTVHGPKGFYKVISPALAGTVPSGSIVTITGSGSVTNTLDAIDSATGVYEAVAFDNIGNLYGANITDNYWRVWSPPGPNTNTTVAVATLSAH
jgi:hypothetical protein